MWFSRKSFTPSNGTIPFRIGPETTYLTEPLCRDGESVDYILAVEQRFAPSGQPEENGYRDLLLGLGQAAFDSSSVDPVQWEYCCSKLDLDPGLQPPLRYEPLSGYLLYSVGMSGRDDGGNSEGWHDEETMMDDIVVRMG